MVMDGTAQFDSITETKEYEEPGKYNKKNKRDI